MELLSTVNALKDVEWYFRRYPFSNAPVSRDSHLRYCCEMYFSRFYQFKERLKKLFEAFKLVTPDHKLNIGMFIKQFNEDFKQEINERNSLHHDVAFDAVDISRIALYEITGLSDSDPYTSQSHYRKISKEWAARVRRRSEHLDVYVEAVAKTLLENCQFLK